MNPRAPLQGIRLHLSGSVPEESAPEQRAEIALFVEKLACAVLGLGGTLLHGSHPSFEAPLRAAALPFVAAGGSREALILVRAQHHATTLEQLAEIEAQQQYCSVQLIPASPTRPNQALVPMREWMAERCDAIVAIGGRHWQVNRSRSGVPAELEEALLRGRPGFVLGGFGGATKGYADQDGSLLARLKNGLPLSENTALAASTDVERLVNAIVAQLQLLPLARASVPSGRMFRILALDGGGLRGTFTAAVLAQWDEMLNPGGNNGLVKHFDLVAGTSTGAILAIGLALGLAPAKILDFYRTQGPEIFSRDRWLRHWLKSKHDSATLRTTLAQVFGDRKLAEHACCRLVIPTVRAAHGQSETIITNHSPDRTGFATISAVEAALASSAAPTYFDEAMVEGPVATAAYLDGGIWANNPVLPAIAEALRYLDVPLDRIDVLSVGTLASETDFTGALGGGKADWAARSASLFFAAQEHAAATLADCFLSPARHLRVNQFTAEEIALDNKDAIAEMAGRGANVGRDTFQAVRSRFLDGFHADDWRTPRGAPI